MKRFFAALTLALMMELAALAALADGEVSLYVEPGCMDREAGIALAQMLERELPDGLSVNIREDAGSLWDQVMRGAPPQLAIGTVQEISRCAEEGLLLPLELGATAVERVEKTVLQACRAEGEMIMAPLLARHRSVAVNRRRMEELEIAALTDTRAFPVWQVMQLYQVLEEAALAGGYAMEIWPAAGEDGDALLTFLQAMYGGMFAGPGEGMMTDIHASAAALEWLCEMVDSDWIRVAGNREEALRHFLDGETVLFIDWTDEEAKRYASGAERKAAYMSMPYPSNLGVPVRDAHVTGIAAFATGDEELDALLAEAVNTVMQDERLDRVLGGRAIYRDEALWLSFPGLGAGGGVLRGLLGTAVDAAVTGEISPEAAMCLVREATVNSAGR